jgi:hypothetical protein
MSSNLIGPTKNNDLAQWLEQYAYTVQVESSNLSVITILARSSKVRYASRFYIGRVMSLPAGKGRFESHRANKRKYSSKVERSSVKRRMKACLPAKAGSSLSVSAK